MCYVFVTDTTRSVYQNKLQRWLLHGPSTPTGMLDLERPVDITARSKNSAESNGISARSVDNKHIDVSATSMPTKITGRDEASLAAAAVGPHHNHEASPVLRMSRSDVNAQGTPYSMTAAECGSESLNDTSRGWFGNESPAQLMMQKSHNMKANSVIGNQPLVTPSLYYLSLVYYEINCLSNSLLLSQSHKVTEVLTIYLLDHQSAELYILLTYHANDVKTTMT